MHFGDNTMKISELLAEEKRDTHCSDKCCGSDVKAEDCKCPPTCKHCNCNAPDVSESIDKNFFHTSVENGKFMKSKYGDENKLYLHDLDNDTEEGKPMLVTFAQQDAAEEARKEYGGKIIRSGMGTFRIIKDIDDLDETTSTGSIASSMGGGNGFANGIGTMQRRGKKPAKKKKR